MKPGNTQLIVLASIFAWVLFELVAWISGLDLRIQDNWRYDPDLGWTQVPGQQYQTVFEGRSVPVEIDDQGFRNGPEAARPDGQLAVVIGDSYSEAVQVPLDETFFKRLENRLRSTDESWQVINRGVGDYGTAQQVLVLEHALPHPRPRLIIHQIFPLNDVCNNNPQLYGLCKSQHDFYRPYARIHADGLSIDFEHPIRKTLRDHLLSYFLVERGYKYFTQDRVAYLDPSYWPDRFEQRGFDGLDPLLYTFLPERHQRAETAPGWPITEVLLAETVARVRSLDADYLAVVIPFEWRVGDRWEQLRQGHDPRMQADLPERRIAAVLDGLDAPYVLMKPIFDQHAEDDLYLDDGHLTARGNELVAEALFQQMKASGLIQ